MRAATMATMSAARAISGTVREPGQRVTGLRRASGTSDPSRVHNPLRLDEHQLQRIESIPATQQRPAVTRLSEKLDVNLRPYAAHVRLDIPLAVIAFESNISRTASGCGPDTFQVDAKLRRETPRHDCDTAPGIDNEGDRGRCDIITAPQPDKNIWNGNHAFGYTTVSTPVIQGECPGRHIISKLVIDRAFRVAVIDENHQRTRLPEYPPGADVIRLTEELPRRGV
jgi:hypothetical protein